MQNHQRLGFAKRFQVSPVEAQGQPIEQVHDQADHNWVALQAEFRLYVRLNSTKELIKNL